MCMNFLWSTHIQIWAQYHCPSTRSRPCIQVLLWALYLLVLRKCPGTTVGNKMSWDTSPKTWLFYIFLTSKGGNPHPLHAVLYRCLSYLWKTTITPTLNGEVKGGVRIRLFSKVTLFEYSVSTILSPIVELGHHLSWLWMLTCLCIMFIVKEKRWTTWLDVCCCCCRRTCWSWVVFAW